MCYNIVCVFCLNCVYFGARCESGVALVVLFDLCTSLLLVVHKCVCPNVCVVWQLLCGLCILCASLFDLCVFQMMFKSCVVWLLLCLCVLIAMLLCCFCFCCADCFISFVLLCDLCSLAFDVCLCLPCDFVFDYVYVHICVSREFFVCFLNCV